MHKTRLPTRFGWNDRLLAEHEEPPLGAHLVTPRPGFDHHGIYVGQGRVIHYGSLARGLRRGPVEEVSVAQFAQGHPVWHRSGNPVGFDGEEVIRRARSRLGEDRYRVLTNNCEHFCEWCVRGQHRSYQVQELRARPRRMLSAISARAVALFAVRPFAAVWLSRMRPRRRTTYRSSTFRLRLVNRQ